MTATPSHADGTYAATLVRSHRAHADRVAIGESTYADVLERAARLAAGMAARGVGPGDRVVLALDNTDDALVLERAVMLWGLVRVAVSARLHPEEISWIARDCDAALVVVEDRHAGGLDPRLPVVVRRPGWPDLDADPVAPLPGAHQASPAALMYTSGTTGRPKGAISSQRAWLSMATAVGHLLDAREDDTLAHVAPFSHFSGSVASAFAVAGARVLALARATSAELPDLLRASRATCVPMVPTILGDLTGAHPAARLQLPDLRAVPYGGSTITPSVLLRARALLGEVLVQFYGASEALVPVLHLPAAEHADLDPAAQVPAGHPGPGAEVDLGADGEVSVRGDRVMSGYWGRPGDTADVLSEDGWYRTGDVAERDLAGRLTIVGRHRDVIISGGFNVYPGEVERVIAAVPGVAAVGVVKVPHPRWGEGVAAVVATGGASAVTEDDVLDACREHLADFKKPVRILFVDRLPQLSTGKPDTRRLEAMVVSGTQPRDHR